MKKRFDGPALPKSPDPVRKPGVQSVPAPEEKDLDRTERLFNPILTPTWEILERARRIREDRFGKRVHLCIILNAKSGACTEDCAFCSQSIHHKGSAPVYPLVTVDHALTEAKKAASCGTRCFSLVTSGRGFQGKRERQRILRIVERIRSHTPLEVAVSLGLAEPGFLRELKTAGLCTLHHNLETAPSFYNRICTTHDFEERLRTIQDAKAAGLMVCSGGIFGLGESFRQRGELALLLKKLEVDRVPVNFLNPIPGTALEGRERMNPREALHTLAALRSVLSEQEILVCGGREVVLRSLQPLVFLAGANGIMTGNYLTTAGQGVERDTSMLEDLQLEWKPTRHPLKECLDKTLKRFEEDKDETPP